PALLTILGSRLRGVGADADAVYRAGLERYPTDFWLNLTFGTELGQRKPLEALRYLQAAVVLRPQAAAAHNNLGAALQGLGRLDEALAAFQQATACAPRHAMAHSNASLVLLAQNRVDEASAAARRSCEVDPSSAECHYHLGQALHVKGRASKDGAVLDE